MASPPSSGTFFSPAATTPKSPAATGEGPLRALGKLATGSRTQLHEMEHRYGGPALPSATLRTLALNLLGLHGHYSVRAGLAEGWPTNIAKLLHKWLDQARMGDFDQTFSISPGLVRSDRASRPSIHTGCFFVDAPGPRELIV